MDKEALRHRLMATFLGELEEHVQSLNRDLLVLEQDPDRPPAQQLTSLFRTAHSLKGAARSVNVRPIEAACHRLESLLASARDGQRRLDAATIQLLFTTADALADAGGRLRAGDDVSDGPLPALLPALERASATPAASEDRAGPPSPAQPMAAADPHAPLAQEVARVAVDKLDRLLDASGELLVARRRTASAYESLAELHDELHGFRSDWMRLARPLRRLIASNRQLLPARAVGAFEHMHEQVQRLEQRLDRLSARLATDVQEVDRAAAHLEEEIRRVRMFPFRQACDGLDRTVRDLALASAKQVRLTIEGGQVELGRLVLQHLKDALLHLVRNAIDHGIEPPDERRSAGKPAEATIRVSAALRGAGVEIVVADDGRGLDVAAIRARARQQDLVVPDDDREAARLVFLQGFSTAPLITELSGRGVGLEIVRHQAESLHGHADVSFTPGRGTRIVISVPVTVATIRTLLVGVAGQVFALPIVNLIRLVRAGAGDITSIAGREVLLREGAPVPLVSLADVLGIEMASAHQRTLGTPAVITAAGERQVALAVDELIGEDEVLVKSLGARLRLRHFAGATLLPSGRVALILNAAEVVGSALGRAPRAAGATTREETVRGPRRRLLVVDDSVTTRSLERSILEGAGYEVFVAADGREAWQMLQEHGADLVVADVEMPRMDGVALCQAIRRSAQLREIPVVLVTARELERDRVRGLEAGANAYLPKSTFDQRTLLETIADLL